MERAKSLVQSKTFWFNVLAVIVAIAGLFGYNDYQPTPEFAGIIMTITSIGNIVLRLVTNKPVDKLY